MVEYFLKASSSRLACIVGVNDVPIYEDLRGAGFSGARGVNEWLLPEGNIFTVYIFWPPGKPYEPGVAQMSAFLFVGIADGSSNQAPPLAFFKWPALPEVYPFRFRHEFQIHPPVDTLLWREADRIEKIEAVDRTRIFEAVRQFWQAVQKRDPARLYELTRYKFEDRCRANGFSEEEMKRATLELYRDMVAEPDNVVAPFDEESLVIEPVACGQAFRVSRGAGQKLILMENSREIRRIDVYVARIRGEWRIVR